MVMQRRHSFALVAILCLVAPWLGGCRGLPAGPSLSNVTLNNIALSATTGNTGLCCCRVTATIVNNNEVPVHATIKFSAFDGVRDDAISTILYFAPDLEPATPRAIDAAGFIFPCNAIRQVRTEVDVKGIAFPPK